MISIVVPCFNEEKALKIFFKNIIEVSKNIDEDFEYIFINDGSTDKTLLEIKKIYLNKIYNVKYISFSRNFGKESAMLAGLEISKGDYVAVMDADLQDPPELLIEMYSIIKNSDIDCVCTRREDRTGEPLLKTVFSVLFYKVMKFLSDTPMIPGVRDYRLMTRQMVDSILAVREYNRFSKGIFSWVGFNTHYISFKNRERVAGESSFNFRKLFSYAIEGIINFSEKPLNIASVIGLLSCVLSTVSLIFIVIRAILIGDKTPGWPSVVSIILFMGGIQLLFLGILGKYVVKMYLETKKRPHYIIKEKGE